jgi:cytochrome P450
MMPAMAGPKARLITGHLEQFRADRLGFFTQCARVYGDVVPLRILWRRLLLLSDPQLIEQVLVTQAKCFVKHFGLRMYKPVLGNGLVTSEGDFWRRQRKLSAPAFQPSRLREYSRDMTEAAAAMTRAWAAGGQAAVRDVHADLMELTLGIACRTLFGSAADADPDVVGKVMHEALGAIDVRFRRIIPIPDWFPTRANRQLRRALGVIDAIVAALIERRQSEPESSGGENLLSALLKGRDDDGSAMTGAHLLDEVRTLFLAGHETTALALTYALYLLAEHAGAQDRLRGELASVLGERPATYDDLPRLKFTRMVVLESMRLYPPADVLGREAVVECTIGDIPIRKGMTLFMSQWVMHRDPRFFARPEWFEPERWTDEFERSLPRFAYFPFGGGPRYCIGQAFASAEAMLILAAICQRFTFSADPSFRLELWPSITLRPKNGLRLVVQPAPLQSAHARESGLLSRSS